MIRNTYFSLLSALLLCLCACNKNSSVVVHAAPDSVKIKQTLIIGKWNLQKQQVVTNVNGVIQSDSIFSASDSVASYAQFNADTTFTSVSNKVVKTGSFPSAISATIGGNYSISKKAFALSPTMTGLDFTVNAIFTSGTPTSPVMQIAYHSVSITNISANSLSLHTVDLYTLSTDNNTTAYKSIQDFYYTR
jgi:hypothetical protein